MYEVQITEPAKAEIKKLDNTEVNEIFNQFEKLKKHPDICGKPLRGNLSGLWQLRSGNYRI